MTTLEDLKAALKEADLQLPVCIDDYICAPGDGDGKWFLYDSSFNDGPPFAEFYNAKSDAMLIVTLLNLLPRLIAALELFQSELTIDKKLKPKPKHVVHEYVKGYWDGRSEFIRRLLGKLEGK